MVLLVEEWWCLRVIVLLALEVPPMVDVFAAIPPHPGGVGQRWCRYNKSSVAPRLVWL